jgi:hypothetical protein
MSYLHQLYGLIGADGNTHIDYSSTSARHLGGVLNETSRATAAAAGPKYRTAWYAPISDGLAGRRPQRPGARRATATASPILG